MTQSKSDYWQALLDIIREINTIQEPQLVLEKILDVVINQLAAERGFILLRQNDEEMFVPHAARNIAPEKLSDISEISQSAVKKVIENGKPVLIYDALSDQDFDSAKSVILHQISSIACVPLVLKGELIGAIYIDSRGQKARLNQQSLDFLVAIAHQAAIALENARLIEKLKDENERLRNAVDKLYSFDEIIGSSPAMESVFEVARKVLNTDTTLLITGETGTGKEMFARAIHHTGPRRSNPFIPVSCAAIPENLLESELFGYKKGAFTGANRDKKGLIEEANQGTLFLDEIAELPSPLQVKLLRFLQEHEIVALGDHQVKKLNVRVVAATNRNLKERIQKGLFREDLFYRLNIINLRLPPLRERNNDVEKLALFFLEKFAKDSGKPIKGLTKAALEKLQKYHWPGNVRELENCIERSVILSANTRIDTGELLLESIEPNDKISAGMQIAEVSKKLLQKTLDHCEGNKTRVAAMLGVSLRWVHYKMKEWDINDPGTST